MLPALASRVGFALVSSRGRGRVLPPSGWRHCQFHRHLTTIVTNGPHAVLGVTLDADLEEVKRAFRVLAHKYHPDKPEGCADRFRRVRDAYDLLTDGKVLAQDERVCSRLQKAAREGRVKDGLEVLELLISRRSAAEYSLWAPHFLSIMEICGDRAETLRFIDRFQSNGLLPGDLYRVMHNDLLEIAAGDTTVEFAMDLIAEMDKKGLQPEMATVQRVFSYFRGVC